MKRLLLFVFIVCSSISFAQQYTKAHLDSLYNQYMSIREEVPVRNTVPGQIANSNNEKHIIKCGFGIANTLRLNISMLSPDQQAKLQKVLQRPSTDTSIVSPKGYFRIHFYKPGNSQAPTYNVDSLAVAADSSWDFEVKYMGFPPPPPDNGAGGDNLHDVYIVYLSGEYGETDFDTQITGTSSSGTWTSYNLINNDFTGYYTTGLNAARVTIAHEFNHSIQVGNYIYRDSDKYFYELTSTSMEIFVYTSIPDYVDYLKSYFYSTDTGFSDQDGYDLAIWNLFLKDNFGYGIIKRQWELMPSMRALAAINTSLTENGSSFGKAFVQFGVWTYYTNYRAIPGQYFQLANKYPLIRSLSTITLSAPSKSVTVNTTPATNNFVTFVTSSLQDTLVALVSNIDYQSGINNSTTMESFQYTFYTDSYSGAIPISSDYSARLSVSSSNNWLNADFLNNQLVQVDTIPAPPVLAGIDYAFPSPYIYSRYPLVALKIPAPIKNNNKADMNIYSISMNLVYSSTGNDISNINGHPVISWDIYRYKKLPTGVYIYVTKSGDNVVKGKLVIFNQ